MVRSLTFNELDMLNAIAKTKSKTKLKTAIYARKSSEDIRMTLDFQNHECLDAIGHYEILEYVKTYKEDDLSGMFIENRPEYQKLVQEIKNGNIDVIVSLRSDRLNRSSRDIDELYEFVKAKKCFIYVGDYEYIETPEGEFTRNIIHSSSQYDSRKTASRTMQRHCDNVKHGDTAGGTPPYGYKCIEKKFVINKEESPAIEQMFEMAAQGKTYTEIIDKLTSLGYKTRKGEPFAKASICDKLNNPKYCGRYIYNKENGRKRKFRVLIEHFDEVETTIPAIVSKEMFNEVQEILKGRKKTTKTSNTPYFLTGLIKCKSCGLNLQGSVRIKGKKSVRQYKCPRRKNNTSKCTTKPINAVCLEDAVKDIITKIVNEHLNNTNNAILAKKALSPIRDRIKALNNNIGRFEMSQKQIVDKYISETDELMQEKLRAKNEELEQAITNSKTERDELKARIEKFKELQEDKKIELSKEQLFIDNETSRKFASAFIKKIEVDDETDEIIIKLK